MNTLDTSYQTPAHGINLAKLLYRGLSQGLQLLWQFKGGALLLMVLLGTLFAPLLSGHDPLDMVGMPLLRPGVDALHPLGTDSMGRDVWAGLLYGARASLFIGIGAAAISLSLGMSIGMLAGYYNGRVEKALLWLIEVFQTVPAFLLVIVLVTIFRPTMMTILIAIGLACWPEIARLTRAEFRRIKNLEFVLAAQSAGFSQRHIMLFEILPNALPSLIVTSSILIAHAILMESGLAFLGLGDPNIASWGAMISSGRDQLSSAWYLTALPGTAIAVTVLAFNSLGDALNDQLNPQYRNH